MLGPHCCMVMETLQLSESREMCMEGDGSHVRLPWMSLDYIEETQSHEAECKLINIVYFLLENE